MSLPTGLTQGSTYSRDDLRQVFSIKDATLNTGIYRHKATNSIWLFVTENKTSDQKQYNDKLDGNILTWEGQPKGKFVNILINHNNNNEQIVQFYRKSKKQYEHAAFKYEGLFEYVSNSDTLSKIFILHRV